MGTAAPPLLAPLASALCSSADKAAAKAGSIQLRGYQKEVIERASRGDNLLVVAPTGSGKTQIAVHRAAQVLGEARGLVVMCCDTVNLCTQQAGELGAGGRGVLARGVRSANLGSFAWSLQRHLHKGTNPIL